MDGRRRLDPTGPLSFAAETIIFLQLLVVYYN